MPVGTPFLRVCRSEDDLRSLPEWKHCNPGLQYWMTLAYRDWAAGLYQTDGISWISQLGFDTPGNPAGVTHDYLYEFQLVDRKEADKVFKDILHCFGFHDYCGLYYFGVRAFGWWPWYRRSLTNLFRRKKQ